jgi:hypothetical protein
MGTTVAMNAMAGIPRIKVNGSPYIAGITERKGNGVATVGYPALSDQNDSPAKSDDNTATIDRRPNCDRREIPSIEPRPVASASTATAIGIAKTGNNRYGLKWRRSANVVPTIAVAARMNAMLN